MTPRDRLFAFLNHQPVDRVPIWLLFPYHPVGYYADVLNQPGYRPVVDLAMTHAVWLDRRNLGAPVFAADVRETWDEVEQGGARVKRRTLRYRDVELVAEWERGPNGYRERRLLRDDEHLEAVLSLPIEQDPDVLIAALRPQVEAWRREAAEFPQHLGAMMTDLGEPIGWLYGHADLETYAIWSLTMPDQVITLLDRLMVRYRILYRYLLEQGVGEVFFLVGSELASPPLVSRATFQRWIVPYAQELITLIHGYGRHVIQHYHGQIAELLEYFLTMGADALHTIEAPPVGNCTLSQAFEVVGDRIGLIGNVQYDEFARLTPEAMDRAVRDCLDEARGRRFMLSPTAGPYEPAISERVQANYLQFLRSGWAYG